MKCDRQTKQASLNSFKLLNSHILQGEDLSEIKRISRSILKFGIICPIVTTQLKDSLIVVDGKKRLKALSYAALPSKRKQTALMLKLGTLADASLILRAIKAMNFDDTTDQGLQTKIKDKDLIKLASRIAA